ncbi:Rid family detoxifying hydrolase [Pseudorhodoferax sp. Leaf265]|jgi:reactive intermediate/imine deaminase|uniref:Rid family detoxifying hydrolase n=1 Tax=Pseudorhodoferax sp. Leaf265 TaxID=1736315 RepID=UPI0009EBC12A|nr:Rid family detoxifying hydrolase [Pseudorhodoferax sp. Leaf265]PZP92836.1 MAG: reactive intermediate/imine deaminase [Variovorax paradoxus]PZQ03507.1 MAG: reactive intermediate/imine deaminase [Variovorax paradoxus]
MPNHICAGRFTKVVAGCAAALLMTACAMPAKRTVLSTTGVPPAIGPYSQMVSHGNTLYLSGVIPLNEAGNAVVGGTIEEQTHAVLRYIGTMLQSQGLDYTDVLSSSVFMKDLNEFAAMNKVYGEYFKPGNAPVRATVEVARLPRDVKVEIAVIVGRR